MASIDDFDPNAPASPSKTALEKLHIRTNSKTDQDLLIWSGDVLMDLTRYEALKLKIKTIDNEDYLFIEAGGFGTKNPVGWQSPWYVMKRH